MSQQPANRPKTDGGRRKAPKSAFKPGQSGNPSGRPKRTEEEFELLKACETKAPEALAVIVDLMGSAKQESVRLAAAAYVIERRYGKATERKEVFTGPLAGLPAAELVALKEAVSAIRRAREAV